MCELGQQFLGFAVISMTFSCHTKIEVLTYLACAVCFSRGASRVWIPVEAIVVVDIMLEVKP